MGMYTSSCGDRQLSVVRRKRSMKIKQVNRVLQRSRNDDG